MLVNIGWWPSNPNTNQHPQFLLIMHGPVTIWQNIEGWLLTQVYHQITYLFTQHSSGQGDKYFIFWEMCKTKSQDNVSFLLAGAEQVSHTRKTKFFNTKIYFSCLYTSSRAGSRAQFSSEIAISSFSET